jgi:glycosyltransferase involved in cell wall biosynthesis
VIKDVADMGVRIKAFGSKTPYIEKNLATHPNVESMGRVTTEQLLDLYSNASFTLFPFTHEPFGYIPLESMACGTPVLTYDAQGPSECVVDKSTGWLVQSDAEITQKTVEYWKEGYPLAFRNNCRKEALKFDKKTYNEKWLKILGTTIEDQTILYPSPDFLKNSNNYIVQ